MDSIPNNDYLKKLYLRIEQDFIASQAEGGEASDGEDDTCFDFGEEFREKTGNTP